MADPVPPLIKEWLQTSNTGDVLHDSAVAEACLAQAIGEALELRKQDIQRITDKIKSINELSQFLRTRRPTGTDPTKPNDVPFTEDEKNWILRMLKQYGSQNVNLTWLADNKLEQSQFDAYLEMFSTATNDLSTESQRLQGEVQALLGRYNAAMDTASGMLKKREQLGDATANNYRSTS